jgi:hypothetical protein
MNSAVISKLRLLAAAAGIVTVVGLGSCGSNSSAEPAIPSAIVNENLNLTNQQYATLRFDRGFVYLPGKGVRGIIVVRQSAQQYSAFEQNCPYRPYDQCATVEMDPSGLFMTDKCCGSTFDLQGQITGGPASRPLRQYLTILNGNFLTITN